MPHSMNIRPCQDCGAPIVRGFREDGTVVWLDRRAPVYAVDFWGDKPDADGNTAKHVFRLRNAMAAHFTCCPVRRPPVAAKVEVQ